MNLVAISAVGRDRPGIVAGVSGALYRLGCNLEETTMARLRDEFAMLLLVRLPEEASVGALQAGLADAVRDLDLTLAIRPVEAGAPPSRPSSAQPYILRVYGADRPGIVHAVTSLLAAKGCNITDLNTRVLPGSGGPVYVMLLEVELPSPEAIEGLRPDLERLRRELSVEITFDALEQETL